MKRRLYIFATVFSLLIFSLLSCQTKEEQLISKMEKLAERIETDGETLNNEDWNAVFAEYEQLQKEATKCDFNQEQMKELGRVEGKLAAKLTKEGAKKLGRDFSNFLETGKDFIDGFMDGLKE